MKFKLPCFVVVTSSLLVLVGCTTTKQTPKQADSDQGEYTYVTETGSRIPTKVKKSKAKSDSQNLEKGDSRTLEQMQQDQVRRTMRRDGS